MACFYHIDSGCWVVPLSTLHNNQPEVNFLGLPAARDNKQVYIIDRVRGWRRKTINRHQAIKKKGWVSSMGVCRRGERYKFDGVVVDTKYKISKHKQQSTIADGLVL